MLETGPCYFVTQRCFQARLLMTPNKEVVQTIGGILAKVTHKYTGVHLHDAVFLSNHFHLVISATQPAQIPRFVGWLSREISVRVGSLVNWRGAFFERRYDSAPILDHAALLGRIRYLRGHGVKEGLVPSARQWPGLTLIPELLLGKQRRFTFHAKTEGIKEQLKIRWAPLPGWEDEEIGKQQTRHKALAEEAQQAALHDRAGRPFLGAKKVCSQNPQHRPDNVKRSPRPPCFATDPAMKREFLGRYAEFIEGLRESYSNLLEAWRVIGNEMFCLPGFGLPLPNST